MITRFIVHELNLSGFEKEKRNTGYYYSKKIENIILACFVEENIRFYFVSVYVYKNCRIKGAYHITVEDLKEHPDLTAELFKKTINYMPRYIGNEIDIHSEIINVIIDCFTYTKLK